MPDWAYSVTDTESGMTISRLFTRLSIMIEVDYIFTIN
jgi:hypothetical protein